MHDGAARFGNFLKAQCIGPGDIVSSLLQRTVELLITVFGPWRIAAVYQALFTVFGPKAIDLRPEDAYWSFADPGCMTCITASLAP